MNQNIQNNQNQISKQQMTQEELQRTQVLNLQELEKVAKFEKRTSKKPAIFFAFLGILSITFGTTFGITEMLSTNKVLSDNKPQKRVVSKENETPINNTDMSCTLTSINNSDGTDTVYKTDYKFENGKLVSYTKTLTVSPTPGNPQGPVGVQGYLIGFQPYVIQLNGYNVTVNPSGSNVIVATTIDYKELDVTTVPIQHNNHLITRVEHQLNSNKETIKDEKEKQGFICE